MSTISDAFDEYWRGLREHLGPEPEAFLGVVRGTFYSGASVMLDSVMDLQGLSTSEIRSGLAKLAGETLSDIERRERERA